MTKVCLNSFNLTAGCHLFTLDLLLELGFLGVSQL
jgi:hypothetical protein